MNIFLSPALLRSLEVHCTRLLYNFYKSSPSFIWKSATDGSISNVPFIADDTSWICRGMEAVVKLFDFRSQRFLHEQCHRSSYGSGIPEMDDHFTSFSMWERKGEQEDDCVANNDVVFLSLRCILKVCVNPSGMLRMV
jgi:hypothetical protein